MTRVKGGVTALKTRRNILKKTKGYRHARKSKESAAYEAIVHAGTYAFAHRRDKKNDFRKLWQVKINAALPDSISYSRFIGEMKKKNIKLDRKVLAGFAEHDPKIFERIVTQISS